MMRCLEEEEAEQSGRIGVHGMKGGMPSQRGGLLVFAAGRRRHGPEKRIRSACRASRQAASASACLRSYQKARVKGPKGCTCHAPPAMQLSAAGGSTCTRIRGGCSTALAPSLSRKRIVWGSLFCRCVSNWLRISRRSSAACREGGWCVRQERRRRRRTDQRASEGLPRTPVLASRRRILGALGHAQKRSVKVNNL